MRLLKILSETVFEHIREARQIPSCVSIYVSERKNDYLSSILNTVIFCELDVGGRSLDLPIKVFEGVDDDIRRSAIAIAKSVSERVLNDYNPEGYEKKSAESRRIIWPELPRTVYRSRISLKKKTEGQETPSSD